MTPYDMWNLYTEDIESPQLFLDWGFISMMSSALQRRVWHGNTNPLNGLPTHNSIFMNQFVVLCGPRGVGKSRVNSNIKAICSHEKNTVILITAKGESIKTVSAIPCTPDNITFEGLFEWMGKGDHVQAMIFKNEINGATKESPYTHISASAFLDELALMFTKNTADVCTLFCQAYDSKDMHRYTKGSGVNDLRNICVNFIAGTTPKAVRRLMQSQEIEEGFASRVIFIYGAAPRFRRWKSTTNEVKQNSFNSLVEHVNKIATHIRGEITFTKEAEAYQQHLYESGKLDGNARVNIDTRLDGYYARKRVHLVKVAVAYHFGIGNMTNEVTLNEVTAAENLLARTDKVMHMCYQEAGTNVLNDVAKMIAAELQQADKPLSYRKLFFKYNQFCTKKDFDEVLEYLTLTEQAVKSGDGYTYYKSTEITS